MARTVDVNVAVVDASDREIKILRPIKSISQNTSFIGRHACFEDPVLCWAFGPAKLGSGRRGWCGEDGKRERKKGKRYKDLRRIYCGNDFGGVYRGKVSN